MVYSASVERVVTIYDVYRCRLAEEAAANRRYIHDRSAARWAVTVAAIILAALLVVDTIYLEDRPCQNHTFSNSTTSRGR